MLSRPRCAPPSFPITGTREELAAFLMVAKEYELNPITREIYAFPKKGGGIQPIVGIDGWANILNSHPAFDGMEFIDHREKGVVTAITCRIYRKDRSHPIEATEYLPNASADRAVAEVAAAHAAPQGADPGRPLCLRLRRHCRSRRGRALHGATVCSATGSADEHEAARRPAHHLAQPRPPEPAPMPPQPRPPQPGGDDEDWPPEEPEDDDDKDDGMGYDTVEEKRMDQEPPFPGDLTAGHRPARR